MSFADNSHNSHRDLPLISIITVVFNDDRYLESTILSVINQSYKNYEYIIIDGGSTDRTLEIIEKYNSKISQWISESDRGIYDAMNKGLKRVRGKIIGILNSGDTYTKNALSHIAKLEQQDTSKKFKIITGSMYRFDENKKLKFLQKRTKIGLDKNINMTIPINHPATFITKEVYDSIGLFNPEYKICGDYDLIYRAYHNKNIEFIFTDKILASMMMGGVSDTFQSLWLRTKEKIKIRKERISPIKNFLLSLKFLIIGGIKYTLKLFLGNKIIYTNYLLKQKTNQI